MFVRSLIGLVLWALLLAPAAALDARQAETVVGLMEQIAYASGEGIYHGEADLVFEFDAEHDGIIPAAGFDRHAWRLAYDAVLSGYMAAMPQDQFDAMFAEPLALLEANTTLSAADKAAIRDSILPDIAEAQDARRIGATHAAAVLPVASRLQVLIFGE